MEHAHDAQGGGQVADRTQSHAGHYRRLLVMTAVSFLAMYALMYAMVNEFGNVFNSINQFYMAGLMAAAMVIIELLVMSAMYPDKRRNRLFLAGSFVLLLLCWFGIRRQVAIGDRQFLRSMIPHHAGAVLMCEHARITDPQIRALCRGIDSSQRSEIAVMKQLLERDR